MEAAWPWIVRAGGFGIAMWETVVEHADRPLLLVLAATMMGLPQFVNLDRRSNGDRG